MMRFLFVFLVLILSALPDVGNAQNGVKIVTLTQIPCQFVESEEKEHGFVSSKKGDCEVINKNRIKNLDLKPLRLKPGKTIFRVSNKNVPYELGFWVRGQGVSRLTLPSVSGPGLTTGKTKEYSIDLKPGKYWYSCPLNPTPDYPLIVE
jgi:hypothetical protein